MIKRFLADDAAQGDIHGFPGTVDRDQKAKRTVYAKFGVREYWIVDPGGQTVEQLVYGREGLQTVAVIPRDGVVTSSVVPGFCVEVTTVLA